MYFEQMPLDDVRGRKVLVIEDSRFFQNAMQRGIARLLPNCGISVAGTLAEGLAAIAAQRDEIFLVLLDLNLPDSRGAATVAPVTATGVPVVVFTSHFDAGLREELLATDILDYVVKDSPASLDYLLWMVRRLHLNQGIAAMVVDDSASTRRHVAALLRRYSFQVVEAASAEVALAHLQARPEIALVITDHHMPGMSGFDLVREIRRSRSRYRTAIIGLSSSGGAALSAKFIKYGANDFINKPFLPEEFFCRVCQNVDLLESIGSLENAANLDELTGLPNRRHFLASGGQLLAAGRRASQQAVVAMLDIDRFKAVNDRFGHEAGDRVLAGFGEILRQVFRRGGDMPARLGGEEFAVLLPGTDGEQAQALLEEVRRRFAETVVQTAAGPVQATVSIGATLGVEAELERALGRADAALYAAKHSGRNRLVMGPMAGSA